MSYSDELQEWQKRREEAEKEENKGGCGCLILIAVVVLLAMADLADIAIPTFFIGFILILILNSYEEKKAKNNLEQFLRNNPHPSQVNDPIDPSLITDIFPLTEEDKKNQPELIIESYEAESFVDSNVEYTDKRVESKLQKIKDTNTKSRKRIELKKLHDYTYNKIEDIEKKCGFIDDPGASPSIYEGLIDWEDAAGFKNEKHKEPWFYYMEVNEKVESSIDKLDNVLSGNKVFEMLENLSHISFGKSIKTLISKDAMSLIIEDSLNELEAELVETYERNYNNPNTGSDTKLLFNLHSTEEHTYLIILDQDNAGESVQTIGVKQFHNNLYSKAGYAISHFYS